MATVNSPRLSIKTSRTSEGHVLRLVRRGESANRTVSCASTHVARIGLHTTRAACAQKLVTHRSVADAEDEPPRGTKAAFGIERLRFANAVAVPAAVEPVIRFVVGMLRYFATPSETDEVEPTM